MYMYRIMLATSGYYYVQRYGKRGWKKHGGWHTTRREAEALIEDLKTEDCRVVGYY